MKNLILLSAIVVLAFTAEVNVESKTKQNISLVAQLIEFLQERLHGHWEGGGMQFIVSLGSSLPDSRLIPNGFTQNIPFPQRMFESARTGVIPMHEEDNYWTLSDNNLLARNSFAGVGYAKHVHRA